MSVSNNPQSVKPPTRAQQLKGLFPELLWSKLPRILEATINDEQVRAHNRDIRYVTAFIWWLVENDTTPHRMYTFFEFWLGLPPTKKHPFMNKIKAEIKHVKEQLTGDKNERRLKAKVAPELTGVSPLRKRIYEHLFNTHQAHGQFQLFEVSLSELADELKLDRSLVRRTLTWFVDRGYLERERGAAKGRTKTAYRLLTHVERIDWLNGKR